MPLTGQRFLCVMRICRHVLSIEKVASVHNLFVKHRLDVGRATCTNAFSISFSVNMFRKQFRLTILPKTEQQKTVRIQSFAFRKIYWQKSRQQVTHSINTSTSRSKCFRITYLQLVSAFILRSSTLIANEKQSQLIREKCSIFVIIKLNWMWYYERGPPGKAAPMPAAKHAANKYITMRFCSRCVCVWARCGWALHSHRLP